MGKEAKLKIKLLPVITEKPVIKETNYVLGRSLRQYFDDLKIDLTRQRVIVNSKVIEDLSYVPRKRDDIIVTTNVEAPVVAAIISLASAAWAFAVAHPFIAAAFLLVAAYSIYSFLTMPRVPTFNFSDSFDRSSPTYTWEGGRTIQEVGTPVPIIYGVHKCWGNVINEYQSTDGDKNYLNVLLLLCEGPIGGIADIKINDNPIENFEGVTYGERLGTNDQSVIPGFDDLHDLHDLNVKLEKNVQFIYTTVRDDVEAFELYFAFPQGLFKVANNGSQTSWTVSYRVEYRLDGSGTWNDLGVQNITHSNRSNFRRIFRKDGLAAGKYHIRVTKTSDNSTLSLIGDFHLVTVDEIRTEAIAYVNSALMWVKALATNQLSGARPNFSCIVYGKEVTLQYAGVITNYWPVHGVVDWVSGVGPFNEFRDCKSSAGGFSITRMQVRLAFPPGEGKERVFVLYKNNQPTNLHVSLQGLETTGAISTEVALAANFNDQICLVEHLIAGATQGAFSIGFVAKTSEDKQPILGVTPWEWLNFNGTLFGGIPQLHRHSPLSYPYGWERLTDLVQTYSLFSASGKLKNYRCQLEEFTLFSSGLGFYPSDPTGRVDFSLDRYDADGSNHLNQVFLSFYGNSISESNTTDEISVAQGQWIGVLGQNLGGVQFPQFNETFEQIEFFPDGAGERVFDCQVGLNGGGTGYHCGSGQTANDLVSTTEKFIVIPTAGTIKNLILNSEGAAPAAGNPLTITVRKNALDTSLSATMTNPNSIASNTSDSIHVDAGDLISIKITCVDSIEVKVGWTFMSDDPLETPIFLTSFGSSNSPNSPADAMIPVAAAANPIRCLQDLMTNVRYGLGNYMSDLDLNEAHLQEMADYCDELVPCGEIDDSITENEDEDVILDLEFEGEDGDTLFVDDSLIHRTVTPNGNVVIDTARSAYGLASGLWDGHKSSYLSFPNDAHFNIAGDFTFTKKLYFSSLPTPVGTDGIFGLMWTKAPSGTSDQFAFFVVPVSGGVQFRLYTAKGTTPASDEVSSSTQDVEIGRWYEVVFRKTGSLVEIFLDKVLIGSDTLASNAIPVAGFSATISIGRTNNDTEDRALNGSLDRMIFTKRALEPIDFGRDFREEYGERFRLDVVIDAQSRALDLIATLGASFRCMPFFSAGKIYLTIDKPQETPMQLFTMGNIIKNSFSQRWKSKKECYNVIKMQFLDKNKDYAQEEIVVMDQEAIAAGEALRIDHRRIFAVRLCQVVREAYFALKVSRLIDRGLSWKTQINALVSQPGDRVDFSHDLPQVGYSGRVKTGSSATVVQIDRSVQLVTGKTYELMVKFSDDTLETRTITTSPGTHSAVTVSPAFSQAPAFFDDYALGEENIVAQPTRIIGIERDRADEISIHTVEYNESVYDEVNVVQPETRFSTLTVSFPTVQGLMLTEKVIKLDGNVIENHIQVSFGKPNIIDNPFYVYDKARIYLSDNGGASYNFVGETFGDSFVITEGIEVGVTYKVKVTSVMKNGQEGSLSSAPSSDITITSDTSFLFPVDAWSQNKEFKLTNVDRIRENYFDRRYVRDVLVLTTQTTWNEAAGSNWDGFDIDALPMEASGSLEQVKPINLGQVLEFKVTPDFDFLNVSGGTITMEISISEDDVTYTAYEEVDPDQIYSAQYIKTRYIIEAADTAKQVWWFGGTFLVFL